MQTQYRLVIKADGGVRRVVAVPKPQPAAPLGRVHLSLPVALRVALGLLLYILKLRLDSDMLSPQRARKIRADIVHLVQELAARDHSAPAELQTYAVPTPAAQPIAKPAIGPAPVQRVTLPPARSPIIVQMRAVTPAASGISRSPLIAEPVELPGVDLDSLSQLSLKELHEFARVAARDTKPMFQQALLAAYRKQLVAMFCGPFSVKMETDDFNYPEFRLICRGAKTMVLKRNKDSGKATAAPDAYEMLRECWQAQKRPQHFRIGQDPDELARELLQCASDIKN